MPGGCCKHLYSMCVCTYVFVPIQVSSSSELGSALGSSCKCARVTQPSPLPPPHAHSVPCRMRRPLWPEPTWAAQAKPRGWLKALAWAQGRGDGDGAPLGRALELSCPGDCRQEPYIVRRGRRKVLVDATLENKQENAYNASLALAFSTNLHFSSLALKAGPPRELGGARESPGLYGALQTCLPSLELGALVCAVLHEPHMVLGGPAGLYEPPGLLQSWTCWPIGCCMGPAARSGSQSWSFEPYMASQA